MNRRSVRVIKLGGSLLSYGLFPERLIAWLQHQPVAGNVIIAGGGQWADAVRDAATMYSIDDEQAHWLCVDAMRLTARLVSGLVPGTVRLENFTALKKILSGDPTQVPLVLDVGSFLRDDEPHLPGNVLPRNWQATSDSIAARLAHVLTAGELILLKSGLPEAIGSLQEAAALGFVDGCFLSQAHGIPLVRLVDLRNEGFPELSHRCTEH